MYESTPVYSSMSLRDLKNLIRSGEGLSLEFKRAISSPEKIAREMAAFANTHGGHLLVGVDDDHTITGVESWHEQDFYIGQAARELCSPALDYSLEIIPYNRREVLLVRIEEVDKKPVYVKNGVGNAVYVRIDEQSVRASDEEVAVLKNRSSERGVTFHYGVHEQKLFRYLNEYPEITVDQYSSLADIQRSKASRILVDLASLGVLRLLRKNSTDVFTLAAS